MAGDRHRAIAWYPILAVGATGAAFSLIKTGRDAVFFATSSITSLPAANLWAELGLALGAYLHLSAMRRFGARRTRVGVFAVGGAAFLAYALLPGTIAAAAGPALFPAVPVAFAALFAAAWLLAGDVLEGADRDTTAWAYSRIGAAAMAGGIAGGVAAKGLAAAIEPAHLVGAGGLVLVATAGLATRAHRAAPAFATQDTGDGTRGDGGARDLFLHPYTRVLFAISSLAALAAMLVELQFYAAASLSGQAGAGFFADYYVYLCAVSLVFQLSVTPWLQARWGVSRALLILPAGVLGGAGAVALFTTVASQSMFRVLETSLKNSIHRSSWEQVFLFYDRERRAAMKVIVDGTVPRIAGIAGSGALYLTFAGGAAPMSPAAIGLVLAAILVPLAGAWMFVTARLERQGPPAGGVAGDGGQLPAGEPAIRIPDS